MTALAALLRQPMMHFLAAALLLFALYAAVSARGGEERRSGRLVASDMRIVVTRGQVESLASGFAVRWRRAPTEEELAGLIAEHVREEAIVREALTLGLDRGDAVIRRQLRLKMEFLAQDVGALVEPSDEELQALLTRSADQFLPPVRVSFRHVFLDSARRGAPAARTEAERLLDTLRSSDGAAVADEAGDRFLLGYAFREMPLSELGRTFGGELAAALETMPVGAWTGPIASAYGLHVVMLEARSAAALPAINEARPALRAEWAVSRQREALDLFVAGLVARYAVTVEGAPDTRSGAVADRQ